MASTSFTLKYHDGAFGVEARVMIEKNNGKELSLPINEIVLADYAVAKLHYYEISSSISTQVGVSSNIIDIANSGQYASQQGLNFTPILSGTNPTEYKKYTVDFVNSYSSVETIKQVVFKYSNPCEKIFFIQAIEKVEGIRKNVTYSIENGNLLDIATPISTATITKVDSYNFNTETKPALHYHYEGEIITADRMAGIIFDLGGIKVSDYKTISIRFRAYAGTGNSNTTFFINGTYVGYGSGGVQTVDLKAFAEAKNIASFAKFEIAIDKNVNQTTAGIYVAEIVLELAD